MKLFNVVIASAAVAFANPVAAAEFTGADDGSAIGGAMPLSDAAAGAFLTAAAAYGTIATVNFDSSPTSDSNFFSFPGLTITTTNPNIGNGFTGISDTTFTDSNIYGYDQSAGGMGKWLGFPLGTATFDFAAPTNSFGFYISGTQTTFGATLDVTIDGVTYQAPVNVNGGSGFFGYTSDTAFSSVSIFKAGIDAWGIDNVSYNFQSVPEPATWAMMVIGFGLVGAALRRRTTTVRYAF